MYFSAEHKYELDSKSEVLQEGFDYLGTFVKNIWKIGHTEGESADTDNFAESVVLHWQNLAICYVGCCSHMLEWAAQESGALLRRSLKTYELLIYFRQDKNKE